MLRKSTLFSIFIPLLLATAGLSGVWGTLTQATAAPAMSDEIGIANNCATTTVISPTECAALVALYNSTDGANWLDNNNWLSFAGGLTPCDWAGVVCANGHVTELRLAGQRMNGTLPTSMGNFPALAVLRLQNNQLNGRMPPTICNLTDTLTQANFAYNRLTTYKQFIRSCAEKVDPDWLETQTMTPRGLSITNFYTDALELSWSAIPYTADGGYYEVSYALDPRATFTVHGHTADKTVTTYLLDGLEPGRTYYVLVKSFTPAHGNQPADLLSNGNRQIGVTVHPTDNILLMVYVSADNNLSPNVGTIGTRLTNGSRVNPNLQVALLTDELGEGNTRFIEIANGNVNFTDDVFEAWGTDELDTADPAVLAWFLNHAKSKFSASRHIVSIVGHGLALAPEIIWPETQLTARQTLELLNGAPFNPIPPLPQGSDFTPGDVTDRSYLSPIDLRYALEAATNNGADPFDILFFDQCFQGNLDVLYEVHAAAEIFIASPNYAWLIAAYDQYLTQLAPAESNAAMAQAIIERYQGALPDRGHPNAIFWIAQDDLLQIASAVSTLADALSAATQAGFNAPIAHATQNSQFVDTTQCDPTQLFNLAPYDELIGAEGFAQNLQKGFPNNDPYGVHTAAADLETLLAPISRTVSIGNPYMAPQYEWHYTNTLTILAPLPRNSAPEVAWRASIYTETAPFTAVWTPDPSLTVTISEPFAYAQDGRWDNFLAVWFTGQMTPTVGQWCQYIPPAVITTDETEMISLTVTAAGLDSATLSWSASTDERVAGYEILANGDNLIGWTIQANVDASQTTIMQRDLLRPGAYQFQVLAVDAAGTVLEQSNEVIWEGLEGVYMPLLRK